MLDVTGSEYRVLHFRMGRRSRLVLLDKHISQDLLMQRVQLKVNIGDIDQVA
jgi:hypothetical protein